MNWVSSAGGPLVIASAEIAPLWRGGFGRRASEVGREPSDESINDYARARGVDDCLGTLRVGPGEALVLGDEPMRAAFVSKPDGGVLIRWMYAENEAGVQRAVEEIPESVWEATPHKIKVGRRGSTTRTQETNSRPLRMDGPTRHGAASIFLRVIIGSTRPTTSPTLQLG